MKQKTIKAVVAEKTDFPPINYVLLLNQKKISKYVTHETIALYRKIRRYHTIIIFLHPKMTIYQYEYRVYGVRGLTRELTVDILHELIHWATDSMEGHERWDKRLHSIVYKTTGYSIYPNQKWGFA